MQKSALILLWVTLAIVGVSFSPAQTVPQGKFLSFNGIDQYLVIPDHASFNIAAGESYTLSCRIRPANFNEPASVISKGNQDVPNGRYELTTYGTNKGPNIGLRLVNSSNSSIGSPYFATLQTGTWYHVAWVFNAADNSSRVYVDGNLAATVTNPAIGLSPVKNGEDLMVGCSMANATSPVCFQYWSGSIDELRIWKRALTAAELTADRAATVASHRGLEASYDFESMAGNNVEDVSGSGHGGELYGFGIRVIKTSLPAGIGNANERLTAFRIVCGSAKSTLENITVDLGGCTRIADITSLKVWYCKSSERFRPGSARLLSEMRPTGAKNILRGNLDLTQGDNYFWITGDISPVAREGNKVDATVLSYSCTGNQPVTVPGLRGGRTILLGSSLLFSGDDGGSRHYRIPAMVTATDGSLITVTDRRWNSVHDLPNHIDAVVRRSSDQGRSWSGPLTIAGSGTELGFGDPALLVDRKSGEVLCLVASGKGFFYSTASDPIRIFLIRSRDQGITWSVPVDITDQIYGAACRNPMTRNWQAAFVTSGSSTMLKNGRLMAVLAVREGTDRTISNYILYSDDRARTWQAAPGKAATNGGEAKVAELADGSLLMSIRSQGNRFFNISRDGGMTWGTPYPMTSITDPSCNGDLIRYTAVPDGYLRNRLLHSIPLATSRKNVSILLSYDEGKTWPVKKSIYSGPSAYSSMSILNDGTIGIYYEVGEYETYQMYFARFSLDWLSDGTDTWTKPVRQVNDDDVDPVTVRRPWILYPNPAHDRVTLSGPFGTEKNIELYSQSGSLILIRALSDAESPATIPLNGVRPGLYFIRIGDRTEKLIVN